MDRLIDLSHIVEDSIPVYPGDSDLVLTQTKFFKADGYTNHILKTGMHVGTHIDAPMHMLDSNKYISEFPLDKFIGRGCILDVSGQSIIAFRQEYENLVQKNDIVLLYTGQDKLFGKNEYFAESPAVTPELAEFLIQRKIKLLGIDSGSPDRYPFEIHKMLLSNNILIIENLTKLDKLLDAGSFEIIAFPLKIKADASLLRVVARLI